MPSKPPPLDLIPSPSVMFVWERPANDDRSNANNPFGVRYGDIYDPKEFHRITSHNVPLVVTTKKRYLAQGYDPLTKHMTLYRVCALLENTPEAVLEFANRYGLLGIGVHTKVNGRKRDEYAEPLKQWYQHINDLATVIDLWECLRPGGNPHGLNSRIIWHYKTDQPKPVYGVEHRWKSPLNASISGSSLFLLSDKHPQRFKTLQQGDLVGAGWHRVVDEINKHLRKYTSARLWLNNEGLAFDNNPPAIKVTPINLLGAVWLQFADEVAGHNTYHPCDLCAKPIVQPITRGRNKKTCSDACRQKLSRRLRKASP